MARIIETKHIYSHLQTDRRTFSWPMLHPAPLGVNMRLSAVGPLSIPIRGDAAFAMIGDDEVEEFLQRSTRIFTVRMTGSTLYTTCKTRLLHSGIIKQWTNCVKMSDEYIRSFG
jgi:hypothetical protein